MTRRKLPARRSSEIFKLDHITASGNIEQYFADVGFYEDGSIGEIFLDSKKQSNERANLARDAALILSIALQHGISITEMQSSVGRDEKNQPHSIIGTALDLLASIQNDHR